MKHKLLPVALQLLVALMACAVSAGCASGYATEPPPSSQNDLPPSSSAPEEPAAAVIRGLAKAINEKDKDAAMVFFADAPEVYQRDVYYAGRDRVAVWLNEDVDNYRDHFEILEIKAEDGRVSGLVRVVSEGSGGYHKASDYMFTLEAVVQGTKLKCLNVGQSVAGLC